jgi:hypothetical protein
MLMNFSYTNLDKFLLYFKENNINNIELELGISFGTAYYNGEKFNNFCEEIKRKFLRKNYYELDGFKYKIDKFTILLADSINIHSIYCDEISKYLKKHNLTKESEISNNIKELIEKTLYKKSKEQGVKWLRKNIDSINKLLIEESKLQTDTELKNDITILYKGDKNHPKIELKSYDYYLNHLEYEQTEKALREVCKLKNNLIERAFQHEVDYYIERMKNRNEKIEFENLLRKQSYKYLFDETVSFIIKHREQNNLIEFYIGGREIDPTLTFHGKKAQKDPIIQKYLQNELRGADQRKFVSVKMVEE